VVKKVYVKTYLDSPAIFLVCMLTPKSPYFARLQEFRKEAGVKALFGVDVFEGLR
jgi:hypothetical protein